MDTGVKELFRSRAPPNGVTRQDIYLVHGFLGARYRYCRDILEGWVLSRARESHIAATVRVFRFDASSSPLEGKAPLEHEVWRLRRFFILLLHESALHQSDDHKGQALEQRVRQDSSSQLGQTSDELQPNNNNTNAILFIAHGLGSWIVKGVLAHPSSGNIAHRHVTTEVRFIDADMEKGISDPYQQYLTRNWGIFNFCLPTPEPGSALDDLSSYLRVVDQNFDAFVDRYELMTDQSRPLVNEGESQTTYSGQDLAIWISENKLEEYRTSAWTDSFARVLLGRQASASQTQIINRMPSSMEAMPLSIYPRRTMAAGHPASAKTGRYDVAAGSSNQNQYIDNHFPPPVTDPITPSRQIRDADALSVVSTPPKRSKDIAFWQAYSFLQRGELDNAAVLFETISEHILSDSQSLERLENDMYVAAVNMYRGYYNRSTDEFRRIQAGLQRQVCVMKAGDSGDYASTTAGLIYHCKGWLASCHLLSGRWQEAVSDMQSLLQGETQSYHARLCRDLALANAYLGKYDQARENLALAIKSAESAHNMMSSDPDITGTASQVVGQNTIASDGKEVAPSKSSSREGNQTREGPKQGREMRVMRWSIQAAKATLDLLTGNYPAALVTSRQALDFMRKTVGVKHFKTLAIATLNAWCLVCNGKYNAAETLCSTTYKAASQSLGRHHPQTLDAMGCLVHIFRTQGKLAEAIGTGMSLVSLFTLDVMEVESHQTHHVQAKFQLAESRLANGDYATAKLIFDDVVHHAARVLGNNHPDTLRYKSGQARAALHCGDVNEARNLAFSVAASQFELYFRTQVAEPCVAGYITNLRQPTDEMGPPDQRHRLVTQLLDRLIREDSPPSSPPLPSMTSMSGNLHPFLISTLRLIANIEVYIFQWNALRAGRGGPGDLATARQILTVLYEATNPKAAHDATTSTTVEVPYEVLACSIALDMAALQRTENKGPDDLTLSIELVNFAYERRRSLLGNYHLDTLCAQLDLTIARCLRDLSGTADFPLNGVKQVSDSILKTLQSRLGRLHPEILTAQLWCSTVDLLLHASNGADGSSSVVTQGNASWCDLINSLSDPLVVRERLVNSLLMKMRLAGLLSETGKTQDALELVDSAFAVIDEAGAVGERHLRGALADLRHTFAELREKLAKVDGCSSL